ncbi:hypothetical protein FS842_004328 [Serendipita sp. 407]|nr:hypothetical protein FS842_004328 [Serendipita sp. 407]
MEGVETAAAAAAAAAATVAATAQADKTRSNAGRRTVSVASLADTTSTSNKRTRA